MSGSKPCHAFTSSLQWKLSDNICKIFVKSFNFRLISAKIPQLQKSEIDDRENENESRLFCQVRLPGGKSFDMVGVDWGKFMMLFILFYSPFVFDNIRLWRYSESRIAQLNSDSDSDLFSFWEGQYWTDWGWENVSVFQINPKLILFNEICFQTILLSLQTSIFLSIFGFRYNFLSDTVRATRSGPKSIT